MTSEQRKKPPESPKIRDVDVSGALGEEQQAPLEQQPQFAQSWMDVEERSQDEIINGGEDELDLTPPTVVEKRDPAHPLAQETPQLTKSLEQIGPITRETDAHGQEVVRFEGAHIEAIHNAFEHQKPVINIEKPLGHCVVYHDHYVYKDPKDGSYKGIKLSDSKDGNAVGRGAFGTAYRVRIPAEDGNTRDAVVKKFFFLDPSVNLDEAGPQGLAKLSAINEIIRKRNIAAQEIRAANTIRGIEHVSNIAEVGYSKGNATEHPENWTEATEGYIVMDYHGESFRQRSHPARMREQVYTHLDEKDSLTSDEQTLKIILLEIATLQEEIDTLKQSEGTEQEQQRKAAIISDRIDEIQEQVAAIVIEQQFHTQELLEMTTALQGIKNLHKEGLVHLDIDPANLTAEAAIDPGLVRKIGYIATDGKVRGKKSYIDPVMFSNSDERAMVHIANDVYQIGITQFNVLMNTLDCPELSFESVRGKDSWLIVDEEERYFHMFRRAILGQIKNTDGNFILPTSWLRTQKIGMFDGRLKNRTQIEQRVYNTRLAEKRRSHLEQRKIGLPEDEYARLEAQMWGEEINDLATDMQQMAKDVTVQDRNQFREILLYMEDHPEQVRELFRTLYKRDQKQEKAKIIQLFARTGELTIALEGDSEETKRLIIKKAA